MYSVFSKTAGKASPNNSPIFFVTGMRKGHGDMSDIHKANLSPDSVLSMLQIKLLFALAFRQFKAR